MSTITPSPIGRSTRSNGSDSPGATRGTVTLAPVMSATAVTSVTASSATRATSMESSRPASVCGDQRVIQLARLGRRLESTSQTPTKNAPAANKAPATFHPIAEIVGAEDGVS